MWNLKIFYITQILREFIFGKFRSSKTAIFAILGALNFVDFVKIQPPKLSKFRASKCVKRADSPTLISRKI